MRRSIFVLSAMLLLSSCALNVVQQPVPVSFVRASEPGWTSLQFRDGISDDAAWQGVMDVLARSFEIEVLSKDSGYLRTTWSYGWATDRIVDYYRVRVTIKMNYQQKRLDIKSEANYLGVERRGKIYQANYAGIPPQWISGSDTRLLQTMKTDLGGLISSVTN